MDSLSLFFYCSNCNSLLKTLPKNTSGNDVRKAASEIITCFACNKKIDKDNNLICRTGTLTTQEDLSYSEQEILLYPQYRSLDKTLYFESLPLIETASREYTYASKFYPDSPRAAHALEQFTQATNELVALLNTFGLDLSGFGGPRLTLYISDLLYRSSSQDYWYAQNRAFVNMDTKFLLILQPLLQELKAYRDKYGDIPQAPYTNQGD